jgi:flagellar export protein FliJ
MRRGSGLSTVLRLARLEETRVLGELGAAVREATGLRSELTETERWRDRAQDEARPEVAQPVAAGVLRDALERASGLEVRAAALRPPLAAAETRLEGAREAAARQRLRIRGLERAVERRESVVRMERRRREARRVDEMVRAARQVGEAACA